MYLLKKFNKISDEWVNIDVGHDNIKELIKKFCVETGHWRIYNYTIPMVDVKIENMCGGWAKFDDDDEVTLYRKRNDSKEWVYVHSIAKEFKCMTNKTVDTWWGGSKVITEKEYENVWIPIKELASEALLRTGTWKIVGDETLWEAKVYCNFHKEFHNETI